MAKIATYDAVVSPRAQLTMPRSQAMNSVFQAQSSVANSLTELGSTLINMNDTIQGAKATGDIINKGSMLDAISDVLSSFGFAESGFRYQSGGTDLGSLGDATLTYNSRATTITILSGQYTSTSASSGTVELRIDDDLASTSPPTQGGQV